MPPRVRVHHEPLGPALAFVDTCLACGREQARAIVEGARFFEVEYLDAATCYRLADEARANQLRVEFEPRLAAAELPCAHHEVGAFVVRHASGEGRELAARIVEIDPRLGIADANDIAANHGLILIAVSRAQAERTIEQIAAVGARATIEPVEPAWVALPGESEPDF